MDRPKANSRFRRLLLCGILGTFLLTGAVPTHAVTYANRSPLSFVWGEASGTVGHYNVYISVDGQPFELLEQAEACASQLAAEDGRTYVIQVEAEDTGGRVGPMSDPSDQIVVYLNGSQEDTDGDGMSNAWETSHGLNPFDPSDADGDLDSDGVTNVDEFYAGTDPEKEDSDGDGTPVSGNRRPVADAGEDQELDSGVVSLDGSGSYDPDGELLSYTWTQKDGPEVELSDSTAESPTFQGTLPGEYIFSLQVLDDEHVPSLADWVSVTIRNGSPNDPDEDGETNDWLPVADAGEDQELDPTVVTLDGSGSHDPDGNLLSYNWTQKEGPDVTLSDEHTVSPAFLATKAGLYLFELVVRDGSRASLPAEVAVTIRNVPPAADAGEDLRMTVGGSAVLDGGGSADPNGDAVSFSWTQTLGVPVALTGVNNQKATLVPTSHGVYGFQLVASDGHLSGPPDEIWVIVNSLTNKVPAADAGEDQTVTEGDTVSLDGSGSFDADRDALSYAWSQVDGPESVLLEGAATMLARFEASAPGIYEFQLVVHDGEVASIPNRVMVTVESPWNQAPIAEIQDADPAVPGDWVTLDGSGSYDPDQDSLTYRWSQAGGPQVMLEDGGQAMAGFYPVAEGSLKFHLVVHDGDAVSTPASVQVEVLPGNPVTVWRPTAPRLDGGGGGCSVGLGGSPQHETAASDIGYLGTLFLPAMGAMLYQRRRLRIRKRMQG